MCEGVSLFKDWNISLKKVYYVMCPIHGKQIVNIDEMKQGVSGYRNRPNKSKRHTALVLFVKKDYLYIRRLKMSDGLTEREEKIVSYMADLVSTSIDRIYESAKEMIKYNTGILTILTALATFFKVNASYLIIPIVLFTLGLCGFIITTQLTKVQYIVGEVDSSIKAYQKLLERKSLTLKLGYAFTYLGFIWFLFVLIA